KREGIEQFPLQIERSIEKSLTNLMNMRVCFTASRPFESLQQLKPVYERMVELQAHRFYQHKPRIIMEEEYIIFNKLPDGVLFSLSQQLSSLTKSFSSHDFTKWCEQTKNYLILVKPEP